MEEGKGTWRGRKGKGEGGGEERYVKEKGKQKCSPN
jgi:hypothetical protein